ncbi:MAG: serine/threonine protein kinase, partial [bacterium]
MVGKTISHYRILDKLGEGGMGVVYKAEDIRLKRLVALKFLLPDLTQDSIASSQFTLEAQTASALDHANICTIYEIDETKDGQTFISMAYYEGETLQNRLMRGPLPVEEAVDMAMQVAEGLVKAHNAEIIHRDINPANIVLTPEGKVKIIDFGLAILDGHMANITGTTLATIDYMSPEQIQAEIIDQRTDIWSLGVLLYEMLTDQLPFTGEYDEEVMYGIVQKKHTPLKDVRSDIPPNLEQVVEKSLQKDPDLRYQSVNELLNDLEGLSTIRVHSKHAFGSRRNWLVGFIIILITALALVAGFSVFDNPESVATKILSENRIAILPFTVQGSEDIAYL